MKSKFAAFILLLSVMSFFTSCLKNDGTELSVYSDTAISSFSLGTLNRYLTTKSSKGVDSTYKVSVKGSNYKMYINQLEKKIYNPDSLPCGTDMKHVIASIQGKNKSIIVFKHVSNDSLFFYAPKDSIDFSQPREVRAYASDGSGYRAYQVSVNIHKEEADSFRWTSLGTNADFSALQAMRAIENNAHLFVLGTPDGISGRLYCSAITDGRSWTELSSNVSGGIDAGATMASLNGSLYLLTGGKLLKSADGTTWTQVATPAISRLIGASSKQLYGLTSTNALYLSKDNGATWVAETLDTDATYLPSQDISCFSKPMTTNRNTDKVLLIGNRSMAVSASEKTAMVWNKMAAYDGGTTENAWAYMPFGHGSRFPLPRLTNLTAVNYGSGIIAIGGAGFGGSSVAAFSQLYYSIDEGLTWVKDARFKLPKGFSSSATAFTLASDSNHCLWIICGSTGQIWRGRLNKLGWATEQKTFTE